MPHKKKKQDTLYGLSKQHTRAHVRDMLDMDYLAKLSEEELQFLDKFAREYYQNAFTNTKKDLHPAKSEKRRALYRADHARRRDVWTQCNRMPFDFTDTVDFEDEE